MGRARKWGAVNVIRMRMLAHHFSIVIIWKRASRATSASLNSRSFTAPWKLVGMCSQLQVGEGARGVT